MQRPEPGHAATLAEIPQNGPAPHSRDKHQDRNGHDGTRHQKDDSQQDGKRAGHHSPGRQVPNHETHERRAGGPVLQIELQHLLFVGRQRREVRGVRGLVRIDRSLAMHHASTPLEFQQASRRALTNGTGTAQ